MDIHWHFLTMGLFGGVLVFFINLRGMYGNGFVKQHYWIPQTLHLIGGFFLMMAIWSFGWTSAVSYLVFGAIILVWELMEWAIMLVPVLGDALKKWLHMDDVTTSIGDTSFDLALGVLGAVLFILAFGS